MASMRWCLWALALLLFSLFCCFSSSYGARMQGKQGQSTSLLESDKQWQLVADHQPKSSAAEAAGIHEDLLPLQVMPENDFFDRRQGSHWQGYLETEEEEEEEKEEEEEEEREHDRHEHDEESKKHADAESFVLKKPIEVIKTEAGELRVLPREGMKNELVRKRVGLGFLNLEPKALLLPQYIDADCLFLVYKGRGRLSWVKKGDRRETDLEEGDVFKIEGGTVFHIHNIDEGQRMSIFSSYDTSTVFDNHIFHSFFVAGGQKPRTILSGFDENVLATAFNVSADEVRDILSSQMQGPIIYALERNDSQRTDMVSTFSKSVSEMLINYIGIPNLFPKDSHKPYNIFKKKPDFSNDYGSTSAIHGKDFKPLKHVNKGVFIVKLKAGAVLAPHWNPRATEIALVTKGEGEIQIVYPNGSAAATERVSEGTVFYVPQHFPMCQIASRNGPFEFMGFSTSAKPNHPQFLAGSNSVLKAFEDDILASAYDIPPQHLRSFLDAQDAAVILPGQPVEPLPRAV